MNEELLIKAMSLFDTSDKWNAFCELINRNGTIQERWWKKLQTEVYLREIKNPNLDWDIHIYNSWDIKWHIKGESIDSLTIHFWGKKLRIYCNNGYFDTNMINNLLKNPKFDAIRNCFDRIDGGDNDSIWEERNFSFGSAFDGRFPDESSLSWYAGNETEKFADQLIAKVRKFQTPEITELFKEINNTCKRK